MNILGWKPSSTFYTLEPIATIARLVQLSFKARYTKLGIKLLGGGTANPGSGRQDPLASIYLQEYTFYQGAIRWTLGEVRTDLLSLHRPLILGLQWLSTQCCYEEELELLFQQLFQGLQQLRLNYLADMEIKGLMDKYLKLVDIHRQGGDSQLLSHAYFITDQTRYNSKVTLSLVSELWPRRDLEQLFKMINLLQGWSHASKSVKSQQTKQQLGAMDEWLQIKDGLFVAQAEKK